MLYRKRPRPNLTATSSQSLPAAASSSQETPGSQESSDSSQAGSNQEASQHKKKKLVHKAQSWNGTWPRSTKASPSTSIARENITGGTIRPKGSPEFGRFESPKDDEVRSVRSVKRDPSPLPSAAGTGSGGLGTPLVKMGDENSSQNGNQKGTEPPTNSTPQTTTESQPASEPAKPPVEQAAQQQPTSSGWIPWWPRYTPAVPPNQAAPAPISEPEPEEPNRKDEQQDAVQPYIAKKKEENKPTSIQQGVSDHPPSGEPPQPAPDAGWYGYLPTNYLSSNYLPYNYIPSGYLPSKNFLSSVPGFRSSPAPTEEDAASKLPPLAEGQDTLKESVPKEPPLIHKSTDAAKTKPAEGPVPPTLNTTLENKAAAITASDSTPTQAANASSSQPKAGSTWAFWSRDTPKSAEKTSKPETGEIAVIGEGSEAQPAPIAEHDVPTTPVQDMKSDAEVKETPSSSRSMWLRAKKHRPLSVDIDSALSSLPDSLKHSTEQGPAAVAQVVKQLSSQIRPDLNKSDVAADVASAAAAEALAKQKPNLLLPSFSSTYQMKENPSILKQITNLVVGSSQPPPNHVFRIQNPPRIRKAIAIGVHGLFPATYLRPMIGQPTGTSLRFANLAADAIRRWTDAHGSPNCEIEKVALEGEGRINERVDNLWKLMLNWVELIRQADLIIMACHSQGVPVGVMLLQKLIDLGIVTNARIGVCAMAGVSLGPFPDLKSSILMGSAAELWEFANPQSNNSRRFELCLKRVLDYGARITLVGSIDDQLVPMESAVYSPANHPYIYRAVFIDGRIHAPDFIAHLIGFALKLRNLGISDHGLIRELSVALAGSLYSGEGHSRLYYEDAVYDLAIMHALETSGTTKPTTCQIPKREAGSLASSNPYVLPWIMRGLLEESFVKTELSAETEELLQQFDDWKPTNKALKDVKYRLEAVRSKL